MKKTITVIFLLIVLSLNGCVANTNNTSVGFLEPTDSPPKNVVALSSSLTEIWILAGGHVIGTTSDTFERNFSEIDDSVAVVGTVKDPSLEKILDLKPDYLILNADVAGHLSLQQSLEDIGINYYYATIESFDDYLETLQLFCELTGQQEKFEENGLKTKRQIENLTQNYVLPDIPPTYLLLRVHSSGGKVISKDNIACDILDNLGLVNIAKQNQSLLSELSLEAILESNPDYIFITTMGNERSALETLNQMLLLQEAWQQLSAVQNKKVETLPKDLFHYKPNARWGDAYGEIINILEE